MYVTASRDQPYKAPTFFQQQFLFFNSFLTEIPFLTDLNDRESISYSPVTTQSLTRPHLPHPFPATVSPITPLTHPFPATVSPITPLTPTPVLSFSDHKATLSSPQTNTVPQTLCRPNELFEGKKNLQENNVRRAFIAGGRWSSLVGSMYSRLQQLAAGAANLKT